MTTRQINRKVTSQQVRRKVILALALCCLG